MHWDSAKLWESPTLNSRLSESSQPVSPACLKFLAQRHSERAAISALYVPVRSRDGT